MPAADVTFNIRAVDKTKKATTAAGGGFSKLTSKAGGLAGALGPLGLAAVGGLVVKGFFDMAKESEAVTANIQKLTGATKAESQELTKLASKLTTQVPGSLEAAGSAVAEVTRKFDLGEEATANLAKTALQAAHIWGGDATSTLDELAASMTTFNIPATAAASTLDALGHIAQAVDVPLDTLTSSITTFGPILANAGFTIAETASLFGQLESQGINVSRVMPALNAFTRNLAKEGVTDLKGAVFDTIAQIRDATSETEALTIATQAFGAEGAQRMTSAIRSGSLGAIEDLTAGMGGLVDEAGMATGGIGALSSSSLTTSEEMGLAFAELKTAILPVAIAVATVAAELLKVLVPAIKTVVTLIGRVFEFLSSAITPILDFIEGAINGTLSGIERLIRGLGAFRIKTDGLKVLGKTVVPAINFAPFGALANVSLGRVEGLSSNKFARAAVGYAIGGVGTALYDLAAGGSSRSSEVVAGGSSPAGSPSSRPPVVVQVQGDVYGADDLDAVIQRAVNMGLNTSAVVV